MSSLVLSKNGHYLINDEKIYFASENKSYDLNEISNEKWIDILKENTQFCLQNKLTSIVEIASYHRKLTYNIFENLSFDLKSKLMLEYEFKFGGKLLTENYGIVVENWFADAWSWMGDKLKELGSGAVQLGKNLMACIGGQGCGPFFESFREILFNPYMMGLETFLTIAFPGAGSLTYAVIWGIMLIYDGYLLITNDPSFSWWNILFDILGVAFSGMGFAKAAKVAVGGSEAVAKTAGKGLEDVMKQGLANPKTAGFLKKIGNAASRAMGPLNAAYKFMTEKMGLKWIGKAFKAVENVFARIAKFFGASERIAGAAGKGGRTTAEFKAIEAGIHALSGKPKKGVEPVNYVDDYEVVTKQIKPDYKGITW